MCRVHLWWRNSAALPIRHSMKLRKALVSHLELIWLSHERIHERELRVVLRIIHDTNALGQHSHIESLTIVDVTISMQAIISLPTEIRCSRLLRCIWLSWTWLLYVLGIFSLPCQIFHRIFHLEIWERVGNIGCTGTRVRFCDFIEALHRVKVTIWSLWWPTCWQNSRDRKLVLTLGQYSAAALPWSTPDCAAGAIWRFAQVSWLRKYLWVKCDILIESLIHFFNLCLFLLHECHVALPKTCSSLLADFLRCARRSCIKTTVFVCSGLEGHLLLLIFKLLLFALRSFGLFLG